MNALLARCSRLVPTSWAAAYVLSLRLIVGYGFLEQGYAKLTRGPDSFAAILHAVGTPAPTLLAWATICVELLGGLAVLLGAPNGSCGSRADVSVRRLCCPDTVPS